MEIKGEIRDYLNDEVTYNICAYCGGRMIISTRNVYLSTYAARNSADQKMNGNVFFECPYCGSRSPSIIFNADLIDENKISRYMGATVNKAIELKERDEMLLSEEEDEEVVNGGDA